LGAFCIFAGMLKMVVTDLDGTLLNDNQQVSPEDYDTLINLGKSGTLRVIATGRSPYSFQKLIPEYFPIDYLVFSSGAGIMNYKTKGILTSINLPEQVVYSIALKLRDLDIPFKVLAPVPENHRYVYYQNGELHPDFIRRMESYRGFETPISFDPPNFGEASQFLIFLKQDPVRFEALKALFDGVKVIRATSPMDHRSIWMEIFHQEVSKGHGVDYLCKMNQIDRNEVLGIGNDYNDVDLLSFTGISYVVANAPEELHAQYRSVSSNNHSGFSEAVHATASADKR